jgi:hypothetical protein
MKKSEMKTRILWGGAVGLTLAACFYVAALTDDIVNGIHDWQA